MRAWCRASRASAGRYSVTPPATTDEAWRLFRLFALVEAPDAPAAERGWRRLRLLSSAGTTYNRDYLAETPDGD